MDFTKDPNDRRRVDAERQRNRDAEICPAAPSGPPRSFQRKNNDYGGAESLTCDDSVQGQLMALFGLTLAASL